MIYTEYIEHYNKYRQKYGHKTAIFLKVGSFFELYDVQDCETAKTEANIHEIVDHLGIQLSIKQQIDSNKKILFAGFPDYVLHKWASRLTTNGWTVVVVDQIKDEFGKVKERKVSRILSPSTHIENITSIETPFLMTLFFKFPLIGAAVLDLTTGSTKTYSGQAQGRLENWTMDDIAQFQSVFPPKEIIIYWSNENCPSESYFRRIMNQPSSVVVHIRKIQCNGSFKSEIVRTEYLQKIFMIKSLLPPKTYLGIRSDHEELALLFLLQFIEEHDPSHLRGFQRNEPWIPHLKLICGNHALTQLQMHLVVGLFDKAITPMGKRAIKERLLSPYSDAGEIQSRLNEIQEYLTWSDEKSKSLEHQLRFMFDIPRLHRKILCGSINPSEINQLFQTYKAINCLINQIVPNTMLKEPFPNEQWVSYQDLFRKHFVENKATNDISVFNGDTYCEIKQIETDIQTILKEFQVIKQDIAQIAGVSNDAIRFEERDKEPFGFKASTGTILQLKKHIKDLPDGIKICELKSGGWIDCCALQQLNTKLQQARTQLDYQIQICLPYACFAIAQESQIWTIMEHWICHIDSTQCIGRVSKERGFHCPKIECSDFGSTVHIQQMRHPLVEATASRVSYVKHNVCLDDNKKGWLIYGMNASGKSTLMKATGICVLLAQAGCFVPATEMTIKPFKAIYTRILNQDNLIAGLSSFAIEMAELREILRNADNNTLVLGDELCSGTESISAQALVLTGIQWLSKQSAKFIFATHLHGLPNFIDLTNGVEIWHLHVDYDPLSNKLIFDRSLRPGPSSSLYGLEVARAMDLPIDFIEQAIANRHKILGTSSQENALKSSWNSHIFKKECELCKKTATNLDVHHIQHRASATNGLLQDGTPMNHESNLIVLCQFCHQKIHNFSINVGTVHHTSNGPERMNATP